MLPATDRGRPRHGSRGHGRDHVLPALVPPYATVPVLDGLLALGTPTIRAAEHSGSRLGTSGAGWAGGPAQPADGVRSRRTGCAAG